MKKFVCLIVLLLITGCSKESSFSCEINNTADYGSTKHTVEVIGEEDITKVIISENITINESFKDFYETFYESIYNSYSAFSNKNGFTLESSKDNLDFNIKLSVRIDEIDEESKKDFLIDITKKSSELKETLISDGYTCD